MQAGGNQGHDGMRALKALVIGLGALIALALVLLIYGLVKKSSDPEWKLFGSDTPEVTKTVAGRPFGAVALPVPADCRIAGMTAAAGVLYVRLEGADPACNAIVGIDPASGAVLGQLAPGGP